MSMVYYLLFDGERPLDGYGDCSKWCSVGAIYTGSLVC